MPCPYFNPRGLRRPRRSGSGSSFHMFIFQSTRPTQTSTQIALSVCGSMLFQSTRPSQTSTNLNLLDGFRWNFNPRGLRRPRQWPPSNLFLTVVFQSTRPSQTSTQASGREGIIRRFQSTRPSQTSTIINKRFSQFRKFQSTRPSQTSTDSRVIIIKPTIFQSTRPSQTSTKRLVVLHTVNLNFNPRGLRRPRREIHRRLLGPTVISIHEAFADLDEDRADVPILTT